MRRKCNELEQLLGAAIIRLQQLGDKKFIFPATSGEPVKCETCKDTGLIFTGTSQQEADGNATETGRCPDCGYASESVPLPTPMQYIRGALPKAAADVIAERKRQIEIEGWSLGHDDQHDPGELASAAACYAVEGACKLHPYDGIGSEGKPYPWWPWDPGWWKPKDPRSDLVRAGALIIAEIERIDRAAGNASEKEKT